MFPVKAKPVVAISVALAPTTGLIVATLVALALVACASPAAAPTATSPAMPTSSGPSAIVCPTGTPPATYTDPFIYCACVGTVDAPDARYSGPVLPDSIIASLGKALNVPTDTPIIKNSFWRCMDGKVYGCTVGANLPCTEKANTSRTPDQPMLDYCKQNPSAEVIPAAVTGHNLIYEWRCTDGTPQIVRQVATADARGFLSNIWYELAPSAP